MRYRKKSNFLFIRADQSTMILERTQGRIFIFRDKPRKEQGIYTFTNRRKPQHDFREHAKNRQPEQHGEAFEEEKLEFGPHSRFIHMRNHLHDFRTHAKPDFLSRYATCSKGKISSRKNCRFPLPDKMLCARAKAVGNDFDPFSR